MKTVPGSLLFVLNIKQCNFCQCNCSVEYLETATGACQESWLFIGNCHFRHGSAEGVGDGGWTCHVGRIRGRHQRPVPALVSSVCLYISVPLALVSSVCLYISMPLSLVSSVFTCTYIYLCHCLWSVLCLSALLSLISSLYTFLSLVSSLYTLLSLISSLYTLLSLISSLYTFLSLVSSLYTLLSLVSSLPLRPKYYESLE